MSQSHTQFFLLTSASKAIQTIKNKNKIASQTINLQRAKKERLGQHTMQDRVYRFMY